MALSQPLLINILGHTAGALIFGIFLFLLYSGPAWPGTRGRAWPAAAAALSMAWNAGSLIILARPGLPAPAASVIAAVSFSVLSLLPAVLLRVALGARAPVLTGAGYLLSTVAVIMHFWEIRGNAPALHQTALLVITIGFLILAIAAVAGAFAERRPGGIRIIASMCLALFAMSFIHFGAGHAGQVWSSELLVHHVGIPLALFVLLQDYRFVLLDAFVRFLANAMLAALLAGAAIVAAVRLLPLERAAYDPLEEALLLTGACLVLVVFAWLRNRVQSWLTRAIFRQERLTGLAQRIRHGPEFSSEEQYLDWAASTMAAAVRTGEHEVVDHTAIAGSAELHAPVPAGVLPAARLARERSWVEAVVPVRSGPGDLKLLLLGRRKGGQRYLSEDLSSLGIAAAEVAERFEALRRQELNRLVSQAELRALQSQIHPHFLFNALNALYGSIPRSAAAARGMVLNLADIFRYFLQTEQTFVPLSREMEIVRAYLEVEQVRLGDRLKVEIDLDQAALAVLVPVLSIQPLVENAIKHGVAKSAGGGYVRVSGKVSGEVLRITVENDGGGLPADPGTGVGLQNVRRRLEICYGAAGRLHLTPAADKTTVEIHVPLSLTPSPL